MNTDTNVREALGNRFCQRECQTLDLEHAGQIEPGQ
jgi:hypothetical protein